MTGNVSRLNRVMVVDDDKFDQLAYNRTLIKSDRVDDVIVFGYVDQALEFLHDPANETIDVMFLDINMPRMNGFDMLDALQKDTPQNFAAVVVIMLTTSLDPTDRARAEAYDCVSAFLSKPLSNDHIDLALAEVNARRRHIQS